jgi:secondary thiamine-phosphate synthase enzyme
LVLNENADPDVRADMETWASLAVPEGPTAPWRHTDEGHDDMPAHVKAAVFGSSLTIPITDGRLALGQWQGIWLAEHRNDGGSRRLVITVQGQGKGDAK